MYLKAAARVEANVLTANLNLLQLCECQHANSGVTSHLDLDSVLESSQVSKCSGFKCVIASVWHYNDSHAFCCHYKSSVTVRVNHCPEFWIVFLMKSSGNLKLILSFSVLLPTEALVAGKEMKVNLGLSKGSQKTLSWLQALSFLQQLHVPANHEE